MDEFSGVERQNNEAAFDVLIENRLKCYVYALLHPREGRVFYIGKGGGSGGGNQRVLGHFDEAADWLRGSRLSPPSAKVSTILNIWREERMVEWFIVRHGLDEDVALHVEGALIDAMGLGQHRDTDNMVRGHGAHEHGILTADQVVALAAEPVSPSGEYPRVFVFQIHKALADGRSYFNAIKGDWKVRGELRDPLHGATTYAVGLVNGVSRVVCQVTSWLECSTANQFQFEGDVLPNHELLNKSFVNILAPALGFLQWGGGYVVVSFDGQGAFRFLRGQSDKTAKHPCIALEI